MPEATADEAEVKKSKKDKKKKEKKVDSTGPVKPAGVKAGSRMTRTLVDDVAFTWTYSNQVVVLMRRPIAGRLLERDRPPHSLSTLTPSFHPSGFWLSRE